MEANEFVQLIRRSYPSLDAKLLESVKIEGVERSSPSIPDRNKYRHAIIDYLEHDLRQNDRPLIQFLLLQEIACEEEWDMAECNSQYLETVAQMVAYLGNVQDTPLLWQAKHASFDSSVVIDAAYFFTGSFEKSIEYVRNLQSEERDEILDYMEDTAEWVKGWFDAWFKDIRERFSGKNS